jgi:hypothetical protein
MLFIDRLLDSTGLPRTRLAAAQSDRCLLPPVQIVRSHGARIEHQRPIEIGSRPPSNHALRFSYDNNHPRPGAVRERRIVYNNIENAILFLFTTNVSQALVIMSAMFVGFTSPITAPQSCG